MKSFVPKLHFRGFHTRLQKFRKPSQTANFSNKLGLANLVHVAGQVQHLVGEAPLVVIPGDELDKVAVEGDTGLGVKDGGVSVGAEVGGDDLVVNVCKKKQLTNNRASGADEALKLITPTVMSLEQCLEFIADDELVEVTPKSIRLRKTILSKELRAKIAAKNKQ